MSILALAENLSVFRTNCVGCFIDAAENVALPCEASDPFVPPSLSGVGLQQNVSTLYINNSLGAFSDQSEILLHIKGYLVSEKKFIPLEEFLYAHQAVYESYDSSASMFMRIVQHGYALLRSFSTGDISYATSLCTGMYSSRHDNMVHIILEPIPHVIESEFILDVDNKCLALCRISAIQNSSDEGG